MRDEDERKKAKAALMSAIDRVLADARRYHQMKAEADKEDSTHRIYMELPTNEWDAELDAAIDAARGK